jgi:hypothetical protein
VFNPCTESAKVSFSDALSPPTQVSGWHDQVTSRRFLLAESLTSFADLRKTQIIFAQVQIGDRSSQILQVEVVGEDPVPMMIPATSC